MKAMSMFKAILGLFIERIKTFVNDWLVKAFDFINAAPNIIVLPQSADLTVSEIVESLPE